MSEATEGSATSGHRYKAAPAASKASKSETPSSGMPKLEIPAGFREIAEKGVSQAKETYEKMKSVTDEATDVIEDTFATASKGASEFGLKLIEAARQNTNAAFDFAAQLMTVKSLSGAVELPTAKARKKNEAIASQRKELAAIGKKFAADTAEPVKESLGK